MSAPGGIRHLTDARPSAVTSHCADTPAKPRSRAAGYWDVPDE